MRKSALLSTLVLVSALVMALVLSACGQAAPPAQPTAAPKAAAPTAAPKTAAPTAAPKTAAPTAAPAAATPATKAPAAATPATKAPAAAPALTKDFRLSMATGGTAGTYYPFGGAMASLWSNNIQRTSVTVEATGGSIENVRLLASGSAELGLAQNDITDYAWNGTEFFKEPVKNIRGVAVMYPELLQWTITKASGTQTVADLKGKRFSVGPAGSGTEANTRQVFEAAGLTYQDLGRKVDLSHAEAVSGIKDRQLDGFAMTGGVPIAAVTDITTTMDMTMLPIDGQIASSLMSKYQFYVPVTVPAGAYRGIDQPVQTVAVMAALLAREDLDADLVYWLTKTLVEKQADLARAHAKGADFSKESAVKGLTIPWHPGAERYYKEIGVLK
jgi:uncharacterized protein